MITDLKNRIYFAADKYGRVFVFNDKPSAMMDMEQHNGHIVQHEPFWAVQREEYSVLCRIETKTHFGTHFPAELFYKLYGRYLTFEESPFEVEF